MLGTPLAEGKGAKQGEVRLKLSATVWENLVPFMDKNTARISKNELKMLGNSFEMIRKVNQMATNFKSKACRAKYTYQTIFCLEPLVPLLLKQQSFEREQASLFFLSCSYLRKITKAKFMWCQKKKQNKTNYIKGNVKSCA